MFSILFLTGVLEELRSRQGMTADMTHSEQLAMDKLKEFYGGVPSAMVTLWMSISGGIDWYDAMTPLRDIHVAYEPIFVIYIFFMFLGVLNVLVGAFVANTAEIANKDREACIRHELARVQVYKQRLKTFFIEADLDRSGKLSWEEFRKHLKEPKVK